jgi:hypothetical protein
MINRYLKGDPIPWLVDSADPVITYLAKRDLLSEGAADYSILENLSSPASSSVSNEGIPGDMKNVDLFYRGTLWHFLFAAECGYRCDSRFMTAAASFLIDKLSSDDKGFSLDWNPLTSTGCRTGLMVRALLKSGCCRERAAGGLEWIIKNQRFDGGWLHCPFNGTCDSLRLMFFKKPGRGVEFEKDNTRKSCPVATASCAEALIESGRSDYIPFINRAAEYFLSGKIFIDSGKEILQCGQIIDLGLRGYPVMTQVDSVSVLDIIFSSDLWPDKRSGKPFNELMKKQGPGGIWKSEKRHPGIIKGKEADRWVTLSVLRLLKKITSREDQLSKA